MDSKCPQPLNTFLTTLFKLNGGLGFSQFQACPAQERHFHATVDNLHFFHHSMATLPRGSSWNPLEEGGENIVKFWGNSAL